ncbi:succinyl- synthetase subunit beta : Succinyl-CoA ligase [ADP-forming] subunit beta OS=Planctomyces brasiliensis (strain ATCC 49424 / DSM 5305 / JCM 21570 / NBRC 103401 / IFAM 1448) GN=sucC PE=3 SV=1: ATP-grasp_2: Ligase_CoA [Gemmataceae bacterium]|jgi:succinyl-CoA synthetase beta subunit|nr:succinyl- synthetase subunit beta : Succinyl-CoA ligase [ADP-forming] subunit beta OS=Planctomyces brasiliensis (strain ATCC 49424 / DSM 5305 / JCM 21570 / NBRC 103401 / IFAM 1448) GN=sucC PE=3 SV=1: ATP-grasp_2: Ligase_CoA [Gemmataceae bacterium]VTT98140.1 succinyl- synthetase subunit beta : Succinyl-CoA ligase [ADP-forming] subunit beta OS=Planctomyces brasiliensis (strain ATCC 49424 / DSM 5305 / JCM 21570 / NBRC 103401 / IFAM 1448) GN=sucC PE=3 SV=1: ATP-grasp_2: Ligase_CoA [Gemmataceae bact
MKIHEYQAKELLAAAGATIPRHIVATTPDEAAAAFEQLGGTGAMVKAQIHAGGRGAGQLKGYADKLGGVKFCPTKEKAKAVAAAMLAHPLVTKQTGPEGQPIKTLIVQADAEPAKEFYVAVVLDRASGVPILMASAEGGMDIEEVAHHHPEKILKVAISPETGLLPFQARRVAYDLGFTGEQVGKAEKIMMALSKVFLDKDASLAEINPLAVTKKGDVVVLDAKIDFDDNALFRHKDVEALRDLSEENPAEVRAAKAALNFIQLDGNIGCLVNGAGLAMGTMDIVKYHGGNPANFLDVGGGVTAEGAIEAFRIILSDPKVKGILVNVFGGIASCATIANALVKAGKEVGFKIPVVVRLEGNEVEKAREILKAAAADLPTLKTATDLTAAAKLIVELSK